MRQKPDVITLPLQKPDQDVWLAVAHDRISNGRMIHDYLLCATEDEAMKFVNGFGGLDISVIKLNLMGDDNG